MKDYTPPSVTDLGSVRDLTQQRFNKVGAKTDAFAPNILEGSLVPGP